MRSKRSLTFTSDVQGHAVALELSDVESLDASATVLIEAGYVVERATADQCAERKVKGIVKDTGDSSPAALP
jgi:hypothetical protein